MRYEPGHVPAVLDVAEAFGKYEIPDAVLVHRPEEGYIAIRRRFVLAGRPVRGDAGAGLEGRRRVGQRGCEKPFLRTTGHSGLSEAGAVDEAKNGRRV